MNKAFPVAIMLAMVLLGTCVYCYFNRQRVAAFLRWNLPGLQMPKPQSPMSNFRPPEFGPQ